MFRRGMIGGLAVVACGALLLPGSASAIVCDATDRNSLQIHLNNASCNPIVLQPGTYTGAGVSTTRVVSVFGQDEATPLIANAPGSAFIVGTGGAVTLVDVDISGAVSGSGLRLNAADASANVISSTIHNNTATAGGGGISSISNAPNALTVTDSAIRDNTSTSTGGGVHIAGTGTATFDRVLFSGNAATGDGTSGGGYGTNTAGATGVFTNVTFTDNRADGWGGAILAGGSGSSVELKNVTVAGNTADDDNTGGASGGDGGGIYVSDGAAKVQNSILADNVDESGGGPDCFTAPTKFLSRLSHELIEDATGCTYGPPNDTPAGYLTGMDPMLGPLAPNGGLSDTMPLLPGSPAIDAGHPGPADGVNLDCQGLDQRNLPRTDPPNPCDLGAFEAQLYNLTVTKTGSGAGTVSGSGDPPLICGETCGQTFGAYLEGSTAELGAVPASGSTFNGWSGAGCTGIGGCSVPIDADKTVNADFALVPAAVLPPATTPFDLPAAIRKCKKKFPKGKKRKKCIKKAKALADAQSP